VSLFANKKLFSCSVLDLQHKKILVNRFDAYTTEYLLENKEVTLDKIGTIKILGAAPTDEENIPVQFMPDRKAVTSEGLIKYIAEKTGKNKYLVIADIESHFAQAREFINIGKSYELLEIGFIKTNNTGVYEFLPYSKNKPVRITAQPVTHSKQNNNRSIIQIISLIIVIAILAGIGWQAYQFFKKKNSNQSPVITTADTTTNTIAQDTTAKIDTSATHTGNDSLNVRYIFEITASRLRALTRTEQLKKFGNNALYDSSVNNNATFYNLYILKPTLPADTLMVKDSMAKFFQKDIRLEIEPLK